MEEDFKIVFGALDEAVAGMEQIEVHSDELDEIAELRRFAVEVAEQESFSYTTT